MLAHAENAFQGNPLSWINISAIQKNGIKRRVFVRLKRKPFKEAGNVLGTSSSTVIRRIKEVTKDYITSGVRLPKIIAIDEYKGYTDAGTYQLIIATAETHEPIDILSNRRNDTIKDYLYQHRTDVETILMDMNQRFEAAMKQALRRPLIITDRFHYCRYIYWAIDEVRRKVIKEWNAPCAL